jgi:hypothetical protein
MTVLQNWARDALGSGVQISKLADPAISIKMSIPTANFEI